MADGTTERKVVHGLRHVPTGAMLRVREVVRLLQDEPYRNEDTTYHLTLDAHEPVFDAGSPERLALVLTPTYGSGPGHPLSDGFDPHDLEPVVVEEVLTRTVRTADVRLDIPVRIDFSYVLDVRPGMAKDYPGLGEILDAVAEHRDEVDGVLDPGGEYPYGKCSLVAYTVPQAAASMPDGIVGGVVAGTRSSYGARRGLGVIDLPERFLRLAACRGLDEPTVGCMVVCLSDTRPLPEALLAALSPDTGPAPR